MRPDVDVCIVGAGPAGTTAATLLARDGHRVVVLDKARFRRFHIGEALLPINLPVFERLGFEPTRDRYVYKQGADFVDQTNGRISEFPFAEGLEGTPDHAWQVERSIFDAELVRIARDAGADVTMDARASEVTFGDDDVGVRPESGTPLRARYLIDATGQDAFLARRRRTVEPVKGFGVAAVFCHFEDLSDEAFAELERTGNVKILRVEDGWRWAIPMRGNKLSFGVVVRETGVRVEMLDEALQGWELMRGLTAGARRTAEPRIIRNFSFRNTEPAGPRWGCVGDAACFLDPVFSSGVPLAMLSAELTADAVGAALRDGTEARPDLLDGVRAHMDRGYAAFATLIDSFYNTRIVENLFFYDDPEPEMRAGLITMLAGDVWRTDNRFQNALLGGRRRRKGTAAERGRT